ncbi:MAG: hypothetical protein ACI4PY_02715 [Akkermansia muciniphila]
MMTRIVKLMTRASLMGLAAALFVPTVNAAPLPEKADLLATNTVVAVYRGKVKPPCRFLTSECPDRCGHSREQAVFTVKASEAYSHPGKYGDDRLTPGAQWMVGTKDDVPGQDPAVLEQLAGLKPGDTVRMTVTHYYITLNNASYPVRPVTSLTVLPEKEQPEPLQPQDGPAVMPLRAL